MINEAIAKLYTNDIFNCICRQHGGEHGEDIKGDIIMMILSIPEPKLKHIVSEGYLLPYALQMVRYQCSSNKSTKINKKYLNKVHKVDIENVEIIEDEDLIGIVLGDFIEAKILDDSLSQDNDYFYHARLLLERVKYKNTKELSRRTNIPYRSVLTALNEYTEYLKTLKYD